MAEQNTKILLVEDNPGDARMVREILSENSRDKFEFVNAQTLREAITLISANHCDAILLDMSLPDSFGLETVEKMCLAAPTIPIIVLTGLKDEQIGTEAVKLGAQDYVVKGQTDGRLLKRTIEYASERKHAVEEIKQARNELEIRVQQRTAELAHTVNILQEEAMERMQAEEKLRASEEKYRELVESANSIILRRDCFGNITFFNEYAQKFFGYTEEKILGRNVIGTIVPLKDSTGQDMAAMVTDSCEHPERYSTYECESICRDGRLVWISWANKPIRDENGRVTGLLAVGSDVTDRKLMDNKLRADREQLRSLTNELLAVEERERREIATELHDSVGQILAFAKIEAGNLRLQKPPEKFLERLDHIRHLLDDAIKQTRTLTFNLSPPELYTLGLEAAIEELAEKFSKERKLECHFKNTAQPKPLADSVKVLLYRSVRELLINIAKHAKAGIVRISMRRNDKDVQISVEDNGVGFEPSKLENEAGRLNSFGLFSIKQRLTHIGGRFEIQSCPGKGTKINLFVPLGLKEKKKRK